VDPNFSTPVLVIYMLLNERVTNNIENDMNNDLRMTNIKTINCRIGYRTRIERPSCAVIYRTRYG
jgi:hypothetical protein